VRDALLAGLTAGGTGAALHAIAHFADRELGGRPSDPWLLGLLALVVVGGAVLRAADLRTPRP
jgi:hypothetical protein